MIKNIIHGVSGYILYKGGLPHYTFLIHRISGLGTLAFLSLHILLESTAHFVPQVYDQLNASLRTPAGLTAEIVMALLVIFHGINGFRIACFDLYPNLWAPHSAIHSAQAVWIVSILLWLPSAAIMVLHSLRRI